MYRRRSYRSRSWRPGAWLARLWEELRWRWYGRRRGPWLAAFVIAAGVGGFALLLQSVFAGRSDREALICLALNVYFEARGEPLVGQYAVAEVTMNRVASARYPASVCGVVYQKNWDPLRQRYVGAFSWTEFETRPAPRGAEWERAQRVAESVYYQRHTPMLEGATHYHALYVKPSWSRERRPVARIGRHLFYK
jgi:hypothetical protein